MKYDNVKQPEHYRMYKIEPKAVRLDWDLPAFVDSALKYIARYRFKGRPIEDLDKAIECLQIHRDNLWNKIHQEHATALVIEEGEDG